MKPAGSRTYALGFFIVAVAIVGYVCLRVLGPFLAAIAWAIVLAVAFQAPWALLERKLAGHRSLAAGIMTLVISLIVLLPAVLFVGLLASQAFGAASSLNDRLAVENVTSFSDLVALPSVAGFLDELKTRFGISPEEFRQMLASLTSSASSLAVALSGRLVLGTFDAVLTFLSTIFILFFMFRDGGRIAERAIELVPIDDTGKAVLTGTLERMIRGIFRGSLLCALVQGLTGGIGWWLAGLGSAPLAGAAMALLSLLPLGGTALVWVPGSIWAWFAVGHGSAIFLFVWGTVVTAFLADNVLRPFLIGRGEELSSLLTFLGVFGGLAGFGLVGVFVGPVALVLALTLIGIMRAQAHPFAEESFP